MSKHLQPTASVTTPTSSARSSQIGGFAIGLFNHIEQGGLCAKRTKYSLHVDHSDVGYRRLDYVITEPSGSPAARGAPTCIGLLRRDDTSSDGSSAGPTVSGLIISCGTALDREAHVAGLKGVPDEIAYDCKFPGTTIRTLGRLSGDLTTVPATMSSLPVPPVVTYTDGDSMPASVARSRMQAFESSAGDLCVGVPYRYYTACARGPGKFVESLNEEEDGESKEEWWRMWNLGNLRALIGEQEEDEVDGASGGKQASGCLKSMSTWFGR